ncbi:hypothetical protein IF803_39890 [Bradyrhizobium sp. UFLA06-06]
MPSAIYPVLQDGNTAYTAIESLQRPSEDGTIDPIRESLDLKADNVRRRADDLSALPYQGVLEQERKDHRIIEVCGGFGEPLPRGLLDTFG